MKRFILVLSLISILFLAGCNKNENVENADLSGELDNKQQHQDIINNGTNNSNIDNVNENEENIKAILVNGNSWKPTVAYDLMENKETTLFDVYGSSIHYGCTLNFFEDGTFAKNIGSYAENYTGKYSVDVNNSTIHFTFETGMKMDGSYQYENGEVISIDIIEDYEVFKYRVTLTRENAESEKEVPGVNNNVSSIYTEITEQLQPLEAFHVTNVIENEGTYTLQGVIYTHYTLNDSEFEKIKSDGSLRLDGQEYDLKALNYVMGEERVVYGLYSEGSMSPMFLIIKDSSGNYYIEFQAQLTDVYKRTDNYKQITISKDAKCVDMMMGDTYPDGTLYTAEKEFSNFEYMEPIRETCPLPLYMFNFTDNGDLISIEVNRGI